jgi:hypothetical protein
METAISNRIHSLLAASQIPEVSGDKENRRTTTNKGRYKLQTLESSNNKDIAPKFPGQKTVGRLETRELTTAENL